MNQLKILLVGFLLVVLQITVLNLITIRGIKPDIVLLFIIFRAIQKGPTAGVIWGFSLGLVLDTLSSSLMGTAAFSYSIAGFLCGQIGFRSVVTRTRSLITIAVGSLIVFGIILYFHLPWQSTNWVSLLVTSTLPGVLYTCCLGVIWIVSPFWREG